MPMSFETVLDDIDLPVVDHVDTGLTPEMDS